MVHFAIGFAFLGVVYWITAMQASDGFWPFIRRFPETLAQQDARDEASLKIMLPYVFASLGVIFVCIATGIVELLAGLGAISLAAGMRIRSLERKRENSSLPGFYQYFPEAMQRMFATRPMLAFDAWTLGVTAIVVAVVFLSLT